MKALTPFDEISRPRPEHVPLGPPYWDEVWDERRSLGYCHPNGQRCTMREAMYLYEPRGRDDRRTWRKQWRALRQVAESFVGPYRISTVFLMLDHSFPIFGEPVRPMIFETMVFERKLSYRPPTENIGGYSYHEDLGDLCQRYSTRDEALRGHWATRKLVRRSLQSANGPAGGWRGTK